MQGAANDDQFSTGEIADGPFTAWALRVTLRLRSVPPGASEQALRRAIFSEGTPHTAWADAYLAMLLAAQPKAITGAR
jgi:hypothetical protein